MKLSEQFPDLEQFFGAYFHQDWMDFDEAAETVIERFVNDATQDELSSTIGELDQLLSLGLPEAELEHVMYKELGCYYNPEPDGISMSEWLRWVRSMLVKYAQSAAAKNS